MARVNSRDPAHRRRIARQKAARSRRVSFGSLKNEYTFTKGKRKGQTVRYGAPTRRDKAGRPIYSANPKNVTVRRIGGRTSRVTAREAMRGIREGRYRLQEIRRS